MNPGQNIRRGNVFKNSYYKNEEAWRLKERLLSDYEGFSIEDVFNGKEFSYAGGSCYNIRSYQNLKLEVTRPDRAREKILSDLKLLSGIRRSKEEILRNEGYKTIEDLLEHPKFSFKSAQFLELIDKCETQDIAGHISSRYPQSHPLVLLSSSFKDLEDFVYLDIETLGLSNHPIILLGLAEFFDGDMIVNQYLCRNLREEIGVLAGLFKHLSRDSIFVTFNGQNFDIPYIRSRLIYHGIRGDLRKTHFDLLHFSRRAWSQDVPNCRLTTLEKYLLGLERKDDIPSGLVPDFYKTYLKTGNVGPLLPIVDHNREDVITLARLFSKLHENWG